MVMSLDLLLLEQQHGRDPKSTSLAPAGLFADLEWTMLTALLSMRSSFEAKGAAFCDRYCKIQAAHDCHNLLPCRVHEND